MKSVVFVSKDADEFRRYRSGSGLKDDGKEVFGLKVGTDSVFVVEGFDEKDACKEGGFKEEVLSAFLDELGRRLKEAGCRVDGKGRIGEEDFRLFVHWGGGSWRNFEPSVRAALRTCKAWEKFGLSSRSAFAISSRRPKLVDVLADSICLPRDEKELSALVRRAEYGALSGLWTRCAVFGRMCAADLEKSGVKVTFVREMLRDMAMTTLASHIPVDKKSMRRKAIEELIGKLPDDGKTGTEATPPGLTSDTCKFLRELLKEEGDYV